MKETLTNLFGTAPDKQEATTSWARQRSDRELRQFVAERHGRLAMIDLAFDEL